MRNPFAREPAAPPPAATPELPGFFGKVPTVGDFISRRVPHTFAPLWEEWLQSLLVASRERLGEGWLAAWLEMPIWHFTLGSGVAAPQRTHGVLIPSVDRVGREFPLTILGVARTYGTALASWTLAVEALALNALDDGFLASALDTALTELGAPEEIPPCEGPAHAGRSALSDTADWPASVEQAIGTLARGETLWWSRGSARVAPVLLRCAGLPSAEQSARFVSD